MWQLSSRRRGQEKAGLFPTCASCDSYRAHVHFSSENPVTQTDNDGTIQPIFGELTFQTGVIRIGRAAFFSA